MEIFPVQDVFKVGISPIIHREMVMYGLNGGPSAQAPEIGHEFMDMVG